jgi:hypothetical protein
MIKLKILLTIVLGCIVSGISAQNNVVSGGGDATGSNGSVSFTVGQTHYTSETGSNGTVSQGVQQPYEIMIISGIENEEINISSNVYPNPTDGFITMTIDADPGNMNYTIFDVAGKILRSRNIKEKETLIPMTEYAEGIYFIKVIRNKKEVKSFKVIKNK